MTLPGPSRTIIVQPLEEPAPPAPVPTEEPQRDKEHEAPPPERAPEREPVEAP